MKIDVRRDLKANLRFFFFRERFIDDTNQETCKESNTQSRIPKSSINNARLSPMNLGQAVALYLSVMEFSIALSLPICILDD